jgi:ABC-type glycerol-3-phosphate transport system permease component
MRQYMLSIDDELLNAARVDGANEYQVFWSVVLPNARPAIATLFILFSLEYWNNLLWPLIVFRQAENMPLAVGITRLINQYRQSYDLVMAGSALATLPIIILFLFLRKQVMQGLAATGTGMK